MDVIVHDGGIGDKGVEGWSPTFAHSRTHRTHRAHRARRAHLGQALPRVACEQIDPVDIGFVRIDHNLCSRHPDGFELGGVLVLDVGQLAVLESSPDGLLRTARIQTLHGGAGAARARGTTQCGAGARREGVRLDLKGGSNNSCGGGRHGQEGYWEG